MAKVTIKDLAKITGYSKSTVSCALNNKEGVGEESRKEIIRIAKEMGYTPNYFARRISSKDYRTIGVILRDLTNPFYANVFCAIDKLAEENDYETIFYNLAGDSRRTQCGIDLMKEKMVSGIILDFFGYDKNIVKSLVESSIPSVIFGLNVEADISCVQTDDTTGAREAVDYGIRMGYKNIFYIGRNRGDIFDMRRADTVRKRLQDCGMPYAHCLIYPPSKEEIAGLILKKCPENSLLICYNDIWACSVIQGLMKVRKYVPRDYSVIGFDTIEVIPYGLTTVDIPQYRMAEEAFRLLLAQIEHNGKTKKVTLDSRLIVRDSVKDLTGGDAEVFSRP